MTDTIKDEETEGGDCKPGGTRRYHHHRSHRGQERGFKHTNYRTRYAKQTLLSISARQLRKKTEVFNFDSADGAIVSLKRVKDFSCAICVLWDNGSAVPVNGRWVIGSEVA